MATDTTKLMQCMEVWGGNTRTDSGVIMPGLDAWIYSEPWQNESAGGDVHYLSSCASGQVVRMLVADVAGHGEKVADTAAQLRGLMRRYVNDHDQRRFVRSLNREFTAASDAGIFATAVAMTFDSPTNSLLICNAGHPPPLWYESAKKKWTYLIPAQGCTVNVPWGIEESIDYEQFAVRLRVDDLVLCYTDSLIEARTSDTELLGTEGLLEMINQISVTDPGQFISQLLANVDQRGHGTLRRDDVTCLLIRPNGLRPKIPYLDKLLGAPRFFAALAGVHFGWLGRPRQLG
jgi:phosphoserine phosphatase RsbU/P